MKISKILEELKKVNQEFEVKNFQEYNLETISNDSRNNQKNGMFFAVPGAKVDGAKYIDVAISKGAVFIVTQIIPEKIEEHVVYIMVISVKNTQWVISSLWYDYPASKMKMIGITGTNGKTTIARMLSQTLKNLGTRSGSIGTIGYEYGGDYIDLPNTTPDALLLQKILSEMVESGVEVCVMEVSSIALLERRVEGISFYAALFTNLTQDHLDYHGSMEKYAEAKLLLRDKVISNGLVVVNFDSEFKNYFKKEQVIVCTKEPGNEYSYQTKSLLPVSFSIQEHEYIFQNFVGQFNIENAALVVSLLLAMKYNPTAISNAVLKVTPPKGRLEKVKTKEGVFAFVDYAHTPDALMKVLETLREICGASARIITVFGCGGDRDTTKRPIMGKITSELSDVAIVTDDNPRSENNIKISEDILNGISKEFLDKVMVINNRKEAIKKSLEIAKEGDIILIAGKGHEQYQIIGSETVHFSDQEELETFV